MIQFFQIICVLILETILFCRHFSEKMPFINIFRHIGNVNDFNLKLYLFKLGGRKNFRVGIFLDKNLLG